MRRRWWIVVLAVVVGAFTAWRGARATAPAEATLGELMVVPPSAPLKTPPSPDAATAQARPRVTPPMTLAPLLADLSVEADAGQADADAGGDLSLGLKQLDAFLAQNAADAARVVDQYCADTKALRARAEFKPNARQHDAAVFMEGRADWESGRVGLLHLPQALVATLEAPGWQSAGPELYAGLDFSWLKQLLEFDHWSLSAQGPLRDGRPTAFVDAPLPNYLTLLHWARLRLLKGAHEGQLEQATTEVLHLADLCASGGTLIGEMMRASSFHGLVRETWARAGRAPPVAPFSETERGRVRAAAFAGTYLLYPGVPNEVRAKALECVPMRCAALQEALAVAASLRGVRPSSEADARWLRDQQPCDASSADLLLHAPSLEAARLTDLRLGGDQGLTRWMKALE